jgi:hypothetical protein
MCKGCLKARERDVWSKVPARRQKNTAKARLRRIRNSQFVWDYLKQHPCRCGESDPVVLEFHHADGKQGAISDMARCAFGIDRIKQEMLKCTVLCANCHRRETAVQFAWYTNIMK